MSLACDDIGQGKVVVLLHAFPLCREMWRPQVAGLRDCCRLILPDLPGFGGSPLLEGGGSAETMADAVATLLDERGIKEPVILGGLSMGGYVSFAFARKYANRLRALILADTRAEADDDGAKANRDKLIGFAATNPTSAVVEQMLPKLLGPETPTRYPAVVDEVRRMGSAQRPAAIIAALQALRNRPDSTSTLEQIKVPALILAGRNDVLTPPALAEKMAARIGNARLVVIDHAGHLSNMENALAFNAAVREFVLGVG